MEKQLTETKNELEKVISLNLELEKKLIDAETKNKKKDIKLNASIEKNIFLENTISSKDNNIEKIKAELEQKNNEIIILVNDLEKSRPQIKIDKKNFNNAILNKNKETEDLKNEIRIKTTQIEELTKKVSSLGVEIPEKESISELIKKIKEIMKYKGFINDKEFEKLIL